MNRRKFLTTLSLTTAWICFQPEGVLAQDTPSDTSSLERWNSLSPEQQTTVRERWATFKALPEDRKARLRAAHVRFRRMSPERRQKIQRNFQHWKSLSPERRERLRSARLRFRNLSPKRREAIRSKFQLRNKRSYIRRKRNQ